MSRMSFGIVIYNLRLIRPNLLIISSDTDSLHVEKWLLFEKVEMSEIEPLFVQYLDEPIQVDPTGCKTVSAFIKKAQKEFSPQLDEFPLAKLTLHRYDGTKLKGDIKISELLEQSGFENDGDSQLGQLG